MKYVPEGEPDCTTIRSKRLCAKCIHYIFCGKQKNVLQEEYKVKKKEKIEPWSTPGEGAKKGKFGGEYE